MPIYARDEDPVWRKFLSRASFGAAIRNLGPGARFDQKREALPLSFAVGSAYHGMAERLKISLDFERPSDRAQALILHAGGELWLKDAAALRLGFDASRDIGPGISLGAGIKSGSVSVDYAFIPMAELGQSHRVALSFRFGKTLADSHYEAGVANLREGRYAEAVLNFDKAMVLHPGDRKIMEKALEAAKLLSSQ